MGSENKEIFAESFEKILTRETGGISKALDNVYPRPDPALKRSEDQMIYSIGALGALVTLIRASREANAQVAAKDQVKPEHVRRVAVPLSDVDGQEVGFQCGIEDSRISNHADFYRFADLYPIVRRLPSRSEQR